MAEAQRFHPFYVKEGEKVQPGRHQLTLGVHGVDTSIQIGPSAGRLILAIPYGRSHARNYAELWPSVYPGVDPGEKADSLLRVQMHRARRAVADTPFPILSTDDQPPRFFYEDKEETERVRLAEEYRQVRKLKAETDFSNWDTERTFVRYNPLNGQGAISNHGERREFQLGAVERPVFELFLSNTGNEIDAQTIQDVVAENSANNTIKDVLYSLRKKLGSTTTDIVRRVSEYTQAGVYTLGVDLVEIVDDEWNVWQFDRDRFGNIAAELARNNTEKKSDELSRALAPATMTDLSVLALGITADPIVQETLSRPVYNQPLPETYNAVISQIEFPEDELAEDIIDNHILTSLTRVKALVEGQNITKVLAKLKRIDTPTHDLLSFLYRVDQQQTGYRFDLNAMHRYFERTGARRDFLMEEMVIYEAAMKE